LIMFKVLEQTELSIGLNNSKGITEVRVVTRQHSNDEKEH
jgi:hypothetical protein